VFGDGNAMPMGRKGNDVLVGGDWNEVLSRAAGADILMC
jgi:Ca2+-binding RTX toxin-like protein